MGTTLDNGIYLPDEGERNCYEGLAGNWVALDNHLGSTNIHVTINDKQAWDGHVADTTIHVTSADKQAWNGKADVSALTAHTGDTTIHVTAADKEAWNGKQDALSQTQLDAVNSGIDSTKVQQIATNTSDISSLQSGKANDSDVVHKGGNETVGGAKTFTNDVTVYNSDSTSNTPYLIFKSSKYSRGSTTELDTQYIRFLDKSSKNCGQLSCYGQSSGNTLVSLFASNTDSNNQTINSYVTLLKASSGYSSFYANSDNATSLGEANKRWSDVRTYKVNNLEPSSLSLPSDRSARIDISSYFTNTGTGQSNSYTVPANGYIYLTLSELTNIHCFSRTSGNVTNYAQTFTKLSNSTDALYVLFPVRKNDVFVATWYTTTTVSVDGAFFIPCQGNI